jgi:hypothetical protein
VEIMTFTPTRPGTARAPAPVALWTLRVSAALTVITLLALFGTAGTLVAPRSDGELEDLHGTAAILLHVVTGVATVAAVAVRLQARRTVSWWPSVLAAVVCATTFVQAALGSGSTLAAHVVGALVVTVGAVWLMAWSFLTGRDELDAPGRHGV